MKDGLTQNLPPSARLSLKRAAFRTFAAYTRLLPCPAPVARRVSQIAAAHGLDLSRASAAPRARAGRDSHASRTPPAAHDRGVSELPSVIVFDDHMPTPDRDAGSARMLFVLKTLAEWSRPVFVSLARDYGGDAERRLLDAGVGTASAIDFPRLLCERRFAAAILSRPAVAEAVLGSIRRADPRIKIVFDTVDVHFVRTEREALATGDARAAAASRRYRKLEARLARASDAVWFCTPEDEAALRGAATIARAAVVPTVHAPAGRGLPFGARRDLLFLGNLAHAPNRDAVLFFAREVFPALRETLRDAKLLVVGSNMPPEIAALASTDIRVLGYVPDIEPLFAAARIMVAPLRFGAGIKGKIGEALAHGLPAVTTSVGAEGMGFADGEQVLIADDPRDFAAAVTRAYTDQNLWQRLSDAGYSHVAARFSPEVVRRLVNGSLRELIGLAGDDPRESTRLTDDATTATELH